MGWSVAIAANDGGSGKSEALFRSNDVDNSLTFISKPKIGETEFLDVILERKALNPRVGFFDKLSHVLEIFPGRRRYILGHVSKEPAESFGGAHYVVGSSKSTVGSSHFPPRISKAFKGLLDPDESLLAYW